MMLRCSELRVNGRALRGGSLYRVTRDGGSCRLSLGSGKRTAAMIGRFFEVKAEDLS